VIVRHVREMRCVCSPPTRIFINVFEDAHVESPWMYARHSLGRHVTSHLLTCVPTHSCCWQDKDIHEAKLQVQGQLAAQYIQEVMQVRAALLLNIDIVCLHSSTDGSVCCPHAQKITDKCFERCVTRPGAKLDDSEKLCTAKCMDRYLDSMTLVSQAWAARAKAQAAAGGGSSGLM